MKPALEPTTLKLKVRPANQYSQLSPLRLRDYERWSLTGNINEISPKLYRLTYNNYYVKLLPLLVKLRQMDKAVAVKTNSCWVLLYVLCFLNALKNLTAFEFDDELLVKSTETGHFQLGSF